MHDEPIDPFAGDPADPSRELADLDDVEPEEPGDALSATEREDVLEDLADLEIYQTLLTPLGVRGLVIECEDCHEPHYVDWDLRRANLRHLLTSGRPRVRSGRAGPRSRHGAVGAAACLRRPAGRGPAAIPRTAPRGAPIRGRHSAFARLPA